ESAIETVRTEIIEPLRALRRKLRHYSDKDVQHLREGVRALEREGEKVAQARLAGLARWLCGNLSLRDRVAAAWGNLALYLGPERAGSSEAALLREELEAVVLDD